ncbi:MAG: acetyltransferase [Flavobacteriales bacterium]|nr:acetyltransferase [Flavobacteriales bacterium]
MAREVAGILEFDLPHNDLFFFDNVNTDASLLWERYGIIHSFDKVPEHFRKHGNQFLSCVANPLQRKRLTEKFEQLGGRPGKAISYRADISHFVDFHDGLVIQPTCVIASDVVLEKGVFLNAGAIVGHDTVVEEYASLGPGCRLLGGVHVGSCSYIGCNAIVYPGVRLGNRVRIGIGKHVTHDLPDNAKFL